MILVKTFYGYNELRNFSYLILDKNSGHCWIIDPYEARPIIDYIKKNGLIPKGILNTHQHFDHIRGNAQLEEEFSVPVRKLKNADSIKLDEGHLLETVDTPGHTMDHQVFVWKTKAGPWSLFSGDTLFNSGVGNCRGGGDVNALFHTTEKILRTLPPSTLLYPGHDYRKRNMEFAQKLEPENKKVREELGKLLEGNTEELPPVTLAEELKVNPFFRLNSEELRHSILKNNNVSEKEVFIELRRLRDNW